MARGWLRSLLGRGAKPPPPPLPRLRVATTPTLVYAIGDVHGHLDILKELEAAILADGAAATAKEKWIVMLGDVIDRGPRSAQVLDHLRLPLPPGWRRLTLCGNHERALLDGLEDPRLLRPWLGIGGRETLASYGIPHAEIAAALSRPDRLRLLLAAHLPDEHIAFLESLPVTIETPHYVFVHAGLRPGTPPDAHSDADLLWYCGPYDDNDGADGRIVVHGHMVVREPECGRFRINVDTGVYASGRLSAVRLRIGEPPRIMSRTGEEWTRPGSTSTRF